MGAQVLRGLKNVLAQLHYFKLIIKKLIISFYISYEFVRIENYVIGIHFYTYGMIERFFNFESNDFKKW